MKKIAILSSLLAMCFIIAAQAQTAAPKPGPELQKLHVFVGHWTAEVEYKPGPWGPGSKAVIEETGHMILGGHFLQVQDTEKGSSQQALWIIGYDPANKSYPTTSYYSSDGTITTGTVTCDGNIWSYTTTKKISLGGKQYSMRFTLTPAADGMSRLDKIEVSPDDKTWLPFDEEKLTKVKATSKK
jgi:hypothetical protein